VREIHNREMGQSWQYLTKTHLRKCRVLIIRLLRANWFMTKQHIGILRLLRKITLTPVDLTGATIDAQIIRRQLSNVQDTRYGLSFDITNYTPTPTAIPLTITNRDNAAGSFTLVIDDSSWGLVTSDDQLAISSVDGAGFSGRIKISFPVVGQPAEDNIIFLLFLVRSDGIVKV
jgi:hypothetical protein